MKKYIVYILIILIIVTSILFWVPVYFGCYLPEKYCLQGSSKLSDILTISAALTPVIIIFDAYNSWRKQKTAELLATESQKLYKKSQLILENLVGLEKQIEKNPGTTNSKHVLFIDFKNSIDDYYVDVDFFYSLLSEDKSKHRESMKDYYDYLKYFKDKINWIDLYRISKTDNVFSHAIEVKENLELSIFKNKTKEVTSILFKIILHK